jgi:tetratricopeptide (TPR) repeat protein
MSVFFRMLLPALLAFIFAADAAHAQRWSRADAKHFVVYSTGSTKNLEKAATDLERLDALMRRLLRIPREENPHRTDVYIVGNQIQVSALASSKRVAGFYSPNIDGSYFVAHRERSSSSRTPGQVVLFHEYTHHLMFRYFPKAYPAWYREGIADYLSTTEFDDDSFTVGAPANHRSYSVLNRSFLPLKEILVPSERTRTRDGQSLFYAQSWALTHYLISDSQRNRKMVQYLGMLAKGEDAIEAAEQTFGDLKALEKAVERYGRGKMVYRRSPQPIAIDGMVSVRKLDALESSLVKARLHNRRDYKLDQTRDDLTKLIAKHPASAAAYVELAVTERNLAHENDTLDFGPAMAAIDQALELDPNHENGHILKAELILESDDHPEISSDDLDWDKIRSHAIKANEINPDNPRALFTYIDTFARQGGPMPEVAIPAMEQVFGTIPEVTSVRVRLARLHASAGNFDRALSLAGFLLGDPHNSERGRQLVAQIEAMRDRSNASNSASQERHAEQAL